MDGGKEGLKSGEISSGLWCILWVALFNLCQPSGHQGDISTLNYGLGLGLTSTILCDLGNTGAVKGQSSTTAVVASVVSVLLVIIVGAVAGVIFWRR